MGVAGPLYGGSGGGIQFLMRNGGMFTFGKVVGL